MINKRSIVAVILLSIITCGIYALYWIYAMSRDIQALEGQEGDMSPGLELLLCVITCGIYTFFWYYKYAKKIYNLQLHHEMIPADDNAILYIILNIFGLSIVAMAIMQSSLNNTIDVC